VRGWAVLGLGARKALLVVAWAIGVVQGRRGGTGAGRGWVGGPPCCVGVVPRAGPRGCARVGLPAWPVLGLLRACGVLGWQVKARLSTRSPAGGRGRWGAGFRILYPPL
jgi:hypothetical protein